MGRVVGGQMFHDFSLLCILQEDPDSFLLHNSYAIFAANPLLFLSRQEVCSSLMVMCSEMLIWVQPSPRSGWGAERK